MISSALPEGNYDFAQHSGNAAPHFTHRALTGAAGIMTDRIYTTRQAAEILGLSHSQVCRLVASLGLGERPGHAYLLREEDIEAMRRRPTVGRPVKPQKVKKS